MSKQNRNLFDHTNFSQENRISKALQFTPEWNTMKRKNQTHTHTSSGILFDIKGNLIYE